MRIDTHRESMENSSRSLLDLDRTSFECLILESEDDVIQPSQPN